MSTSRTVLVADDDTARAGQLRGMLSDRGWQVTLARDAVSATAVALRERPDAIVLGQSLPGGGGIVPLRRVRAAVHTAGIPVIAIAGGLGDVDALSLEGAQRCLPADADAAAIAACLHEHFFERLHVLEAPTSILHHPDRLAALEGTGLLDSPTSEPFETLTRVTASLLSVRVALVSLVDGERQFFKSSIGLPEPWASRRETRLTHSFCQWVVSDYAALVVDDAHTHPVLRDNRALHELGVVAYAGMPITSNSGEAIGSFCAIDSKARHWSEEETSLLRALTSVANALIAIAEDDFRQQQGESDDEMDRIVQSLTTSAVGRAIGTLAVILRREQPPLSDPDRKDLLSLLHWLGERLVRTTS
jgi:CheY-like chemotaxis protein